MELCVNNEGAYCLYCGVCGLELCREEANNPCSNCGYCENGGLIIETY